MRSQTMIRWASRMVPSALRGDWREGWESELWHFTHARHRTGRELTRFAWGAVPDAWWTWWRSGLRGEPWFESACSSLVTLAAIAALLAALHAFVLATATVRLLWSAGLQIPCALLLVPTVTRLLHRDAPRLKRRQFFELTKLFLILVIVGQAALYLAPSTLEPHAVLAGCVLGFRWAILDGRRRCPLCLRRLVRPVTLGDASRILLADHGVDECCDRGHGTLRTPAFATSYAAAVWSGGLKGDM